MNCFFSIPPNVIKLLTVRVKVWKCEFPLLLTMKYTCSGTRQPSSNFRYWNMNNTPEFERWSNNARILKYADDSLIVSHLQGSVHDCGPVLEGFVNWCDHPFLQINVCNTKKLYIDFLKNPCPPAPSMIKGVLVAAVQHCNIWALSFMIKWTLMRLWGLS